MFSAGKQFVIPSWEAAVRTMAVGERALFRIRHPSVYTHTL